MKRLFFFLLAGTALVFAACNSDANDKGAGGKDSSGSATNAASPTLSKEAKDERNKAVVMQAVQAVNSHDPAAIMKDATNDAVDYNDGSMPPMRGKDSTVAMMKAWLTAFPDIKGENLKAVADGEWVVVWGDWSGTWKGDFMGQKATGKAYKLRDADIFRVNDDGKITEHHTLSTWPVMAMQTGMKMQ